MELLNSSAPGRISCPQLLESPTPICRTTGVCGLTSFSKLDRGKTSPRDSPYRKKCSERRWMIITGWSKANIKIRGEGRYSGTHWQNLPFICWDPSRLMCPRQKEGCELIQTSR